MTFNKKEYSRGHAGRVHVTCQLRGVLAERQVLDLVIVRGAVEVTDDIDGIASLEPPLKQVP